MYIIHQRIRALLASDKVRHIDMLRLVMLYALRYESHSNNDVSGLVDVLKQKGISPENRQVCRFIHSLFESSSYIYLLERDMRLMKEE